MLDFSDEEFVQKVYFDKNINHYIASLDCNLILKEEIKKDKKKNFAPNQNDIGWMTSAVANYYNFSGFGVTYNLILYPKIIDEYSYKYKFYDTVKKIRDCKIYSSFSYYKGNGFEFQRIIGPKKMI